MIGGDSINKREKELEKLFLEEEKETLEKLKKNYAEALDEIDLKLAALNGRQDSEMQNVVYQIKYQKEIKSQIQAALDTLHSNNFETVADYLTKSYDDGFIGTLYDLQGQGIPLIIPIDRKQVVNAIKNETKLSKSLYDSLDTKELSKQIAAEISRGIASASMYDEIAANIERKTGIDQNKAMRIARTEAHRIQNNAIYDCQNEALKRGADLVKVWSAALDGRTRPHHMELDGQVREMDEPFEIEGKTAMFPSDFGDPSEDCNCRCRCNSKARWLLDSEQTKNIGNTEKMTDEQLQNIADKLGIDVDELRKYSDQIIPVKAKNYDDFRRQYEKLVNHDKVDRVRSNVQKMKDADLVFKDKPDSTISAKQKFEDSLEVSNAHKNLPTKVKTSLPDVTFEFGHDINGCDYVNKVIHVGIGTSEEKINHEYGHLIEKYMMNQKDVDEYKKFLTEGLSLSDIKKEVYYDSVGNPVEIYVLKGDRFETEYQSRLYVDNPFDALNKDGSINTDHMLECISEPFRKYMNHEKISDQVLELIEGAVL